jgi:hypothetical protein
MDLPTPELGALAQWLATICGLASILAAILPPATRRSPRWWRLTRRVLDGLGANVRNARNRVT